MNLLNSTGSIWLPPPDLTISQWADEYRRIPPEASAEPGRWYTDRAPYQRAMLDAVCSCERIVMMTAAQIGKTEILLNTLGYYIDKEPSPVLLLQPTLEMGESFSKDRLAPMIRDTPCLSAKIADPRTRDSGNTLLHKKFDGGHITIAGANSPASLASRPIRILLCDEVDRYPVSAGTEGDPLSLAMKRTQNFWNRRVIWVSTPTLEGLSRIQKAYEISTMEEWEVPCPSCGEYTAFVWENIYYKDVTEPVMECPHCHKRFGGHDWKAHQLLGRWEKHNDVKDIRGFHLNAFASPWVSWQSLIDQYEEAYRNGEDTLKVWRNTVLGLPYENLAGTIDIETVQEKGEDYGAELPDGVLVLTCGVDVQDNRLELEVVGWGLGKESWGIEYRVIHGTPGASYVWQELDAFLSRTWYFSDGSGLALSCVCIDSAGHFTDEVYRFVQGKASRKIYAIVGRGQFGLACVSKPNRNNRRKIPLFTLGVTTIKSMLYSRLKASHGEAGYCHFPSDKGRGYDEHYYKGLLSERMTIKRRNGQEFVAWELRGRHVRNEPLDCRVYATGALEILNPDMRKRAMQKGHLPAPSTPPQKKTIKRRTGMLRRGLMI